MRLLPARLSSKPQYVLHPTRAVRRALHRVENETAARRLVARVPWGVTLEVYPSDAIGYSIMTGGVFDPCVTETLHRLIDPGDVVVDVGANIGYLTSLAAVRAGGDGAVLAYEPHPSVFELLASNVARWRAEATGLAPVTVRQEALSDRAGTGTLDAGPVFHANMGLAALRSPAEGTEGIAVALRRLDEAISAAHRPTVGLLKIDVEGHEPAVLRGAGALLDEGRVRDVVFEDHDPYPSEATSVVEAAGYRLFSLDNDLFGLRLGAPADRGQTAGWPGPSYLATRDERRALARLRPRGWQVRGIGPRLPGAIRRAVSHLPSHT
jgi:FkbM family methyltransferase